MSRARTALFAVALALSLVAPAGASAEDFVPGSGQAAATVLRTGPYSGRINLSVGFGQSLADYQGGVGRAQSRNIDFGVIGVLVTLPQCNGDPPPVDPDFLATFTLRSDSAEGQAKRSKAAAGGLGIQEVDATKEPSGRAVTTVARFDVPALFAIAGGRADARSGIVQGQKRRSTATVDVSDLDLLGGIVRLRGLHWEGVHETGPAGKVERAKGTFSIAAATVAGQAVDVAAKPTEAAIAAVNQAMVFTGLALVPPRSEIARGVLHTSPLSLQIINSRLAQLTIRPLIEAAYPVRQPVADAIVGLECRAAIPIAIADVMIAALSGNGGIVLQVGGLSVTTEAERFADPFAVKLGGGNASAPAGFGDVAPSAPAIAPSLPTISGAPALVPSAGGSRGTLPAGLTGRQGSIAGDRGGAALAAGLLGVLVVMMLAVADYVRMRRSAA